MFPRRGLLSVCVLLFAVPVLLANDEIPKAAWKRPIGKPLENPGTKKTSLDGGHIDDGFWQGAPVGGFGAGTFSRTFRGDFARWHVHPGINNYKATSYPVAVDRWHADKPTNKRVTVSVLLSWTNMRGGFRNPDRDFRAALSEGNYNRFAFEKFSNATMKGIIFERTRGGNIPNAWDGQMTIAALETPGVEVSYLTTYSPDGNGSEVWSTFSKDGTLATSTKPWLSSGES